MTHDELIKALNYLHPGTSWSYSGDGSSLEPGEDGDGGLIWNEELILRPSLVQLQGAFNSIIPSTPPPGLVDAVNAVTSALTFEQAQTNLAALIAP